MTRQEMMDYVASNWGLEDWRTIELFRMEERDESLESFYLSLIGGEEHA